MGRNSIALLFACVLISFGIAASPAKAGDYYEDGYYRHRHSDNVSYSSDCCYRKTVRHERRVHYSRVEDEDSYRSSYYERPYRSSYYQSPYRSSYYERPYRSSYSYDSPRYYSDDSYSRTRYADYGYSSSGAQCWPMQMDGIIGGPWVGVRAGCR